MLRCTATELTTSDDDVLLVLRVDPGERVHETTKGDAYLRVGDESRPLGYAQRPQSLFPSAVVRVLRYADTNRATGAAMALYQGAMSEAKVPFPSRSTRPPR